MRRDAVSYGCRGGAGLGPREAQSIYLGRLIRGGGIIFLDDHQLPGVARAASFCITNPGWTLEEVSTPDALHQWAVLRTTTTKPKERPLDYFMDFQAQPTPTAARLGPARVPSDANTRWFVLSCPSEDGGVQVDVADDLTASTFSCRLAGLTSPKTVRGTAVRPAGVGLVRVPRRG